MAFLPSEGTNQVLQWLVDPMDPRLQKAKTCSRALGWGQLVWEVL